ncbi:MAG: hypothetical protein JJ974_01295 [Phycisphaerales bacterium]|nr:hypothetical protein [Phycisphaerales bacterium]
MTIAPIHPRASTTQSRTRGFVMPIIILLMVVVGLTISLSLRRLSAQQLVVARQVSAYYEHHSGRGLQEAIGAWLRQQNGRELDEVLEPNTGKAMDIILSDGSVVSISLFDAQGTMLSDLSSVGVNQIDEVGLSLQILSRNVGTEEYMQYTRPFGPSGVSVHTAPEIVLRSIGESVAEGKGIRFADDIKLIRDSGERITRQMLVESATRAGVNSEQRAAILRRFSTDVQIWGVVVEVRGGRGLSKGRLLARYGGITRIRSNTGRRSASNAMEIGAFYTWKDLGIDSQSIDPADLY